MSSATEFRFPAVIKDPDETRSVVLNFYAMCANKWRRNEKFDLAEHVRPTRPTGFAYKVINAAGTSGAREPVWPLAIGRTVPDGSLLWECVAAGDNGLNPITSLQVSASGIDAGTPVVSESVKVLVDYVGGTLGQDHEVKFTPTVAGKPRVARQLVQVRKQ